MATAGIIGGGLLLGGIASGIGSSKLAAAQEEAAQNQLAASQAFQNQQAGFANQFIPGAVQAQQAQLGLLGQGGDPNAAQNLLNSPLVQALQQQNQQNVDAQAAYSGVSGGNLLSALQDANTATIMQAGFGGLGSIMGQGSQAGLGFMGLSGQGLGMANQAQAALGQAQGAQAAMPWLTGANVINQGTQLAGFGLGGGFGAETQAAMQNFGNPFASKAATAPAGQAMGALAAPTANPFMF